MHILPTSLENMRSLLGIILLFWLPTTINALPASSSNSTGKIDKFVVYWMNQTCYAGVFERQQPSTSLSTFRENCASPSVRANTVIGDENRSYTTVDLDKDEPNLPYKDNGPGGSKARGQVEVICETSNASPNVSDIKNITLSEALKGKETTTNSGRQMNLCQLADLQVGKLDTVPPKGTTRCLPFGKHGSAMGSLCLPTERYLKEVYSGSETYSSTFFCSWFALVPALITELCGTGGKAGGIVRYGKYRIHREEDGKFGRDGVSERGAKVLTWTYDFTLHHS
ncbi:hypothetical protein BJ508DRAFT_338973 [Ascobolus immersus RN42]|uniref:Ecp2 effector protein domain-containing protein n=1 Tax=Ascobolus immersus RN42 TaxID=1160509 RepID=A0A3N4IGR6_ASCIM|nr:hypothetical protein BJ508DRAFT_338973 [Ascobolus immersus RN42]